jgi:hypothetical protein
VHGDTKYFEAKSCRSADESGANAFLMSLHAMEWTRAIHQRFACGPADGLFHPIAGRGREWRGMRLEISNKHQSLMDFDAQYSK